jgi:hypothetical protein
MRQMAQPQKSARKRLLKRWKSHGSAVQRAAAKIKGPQGPKENASWTVEELKKDEELLAAITTIDKVYGHDDTKAIRTGVLAFKKAEVLLLASCPKLGCARIRRLTHHLRTGTAGGTDGSKA